MKVYIATARNRKILYHGTDGANVRTILKMGLRPSSETRNGHYNVITDADFRSRSLKTMTGVYLAKNPHLALEFSAQLIAKNHKNDVSVWKRFEDDSDPKGSLILSEPGHAKYHQALVICQVEDSTALPDEDVLTKEDYGLGKSFLEAMTGVELTDEQLVPYKVKAYEIYLLACAKLSGKSTSKTDKILSKFVDEVIKSVFNSNKASIPKGVSGIPPDIRAKIENFILESCLRSAAYLPPLVETQFKSKLLRWINAKLDKTNPLRESDLIRLLPPAEAELKFRESLLVLMKAFKGITSTQHVDAVTVPGVGFKGANKILAIIIVSSMLRDDSTFIFDAKVGYTDNSPEAREVTHSFITDLSEQVVEEITEGGGNSFDYTYARHNTGKINNPNISYLGELLGNGSDGDDDDDQDINDTPIPPQAVKYHSEVKELIINGRSIKTRLFKVVRHSRKAVRRDDAFDRAFDNNNNADRAANIEKLKAFKHSIS